MHESPSDSPEAPSSIPNVNFPQEGFGFFFFFLFLSQESTTEVTAL